MTYHRHPDAGTRIPGSVFVRDYCPGCGTAMRVTVERFEKGLHLRCEKCAPHRPKGCVVSRQPGATDDITGYQANAIRNMEGD